MHGGEADNNFLSLQHGAAVCTSVSTARCRDVAEAAHEQQRYPIDCGLAG